MKGYVRKRGNKWSYTVDIGRDLQNKRKQKTKSGFSTKKEATAAMNETIYELNKGTWINSNDIRMKDFALDWIDGHQNKIRSTTADQYNSKIKNYVIPLLGEYKLQDLKPIHGEKYSKELLKLTTSRDTAHKIFAVTKLILKRAVTLEIISKNPFADASVIKEEKQKLQTWTFEELDHFLNTVKEHDSFYYNVFTIAAYTGLRKGEVLGIRRSDVDLKNNTVSITQSIAETKKEGVHISRLKTPSSYRQVAIDPFITSILKEQIKKNNEMRIKFGNEYKDSDLVFCHLDGELYRPTSLNRPFRKFIELAGVPYIRFHDLRHTHATLLLELKANPKVVADRLGHKSVKITLDTYSHPSMDIQSDIANLFSVTTRNKQGGQNVVKPKQKPL